MKLWTGDTQLLSCSLRATVWEGHCGFLSHWSWATVPSVVEDRLMTLSECLSAHRKGQIVLGNSVYKVKRGLTSIKVVEKGPVLKICFGPPTAESKNLKNHVNFDVGDLLFRSPALWSSQNVFGPPTAGRVVVDFKDRGEGGVDLRRPGATGVLQ